jgi:hypothetical protein
MITELRATWRVYLKPSSNHQDNQDGGQHFSRKNFPQQIFAPSFFVGILIVPSSLAYSACFEILRSKIEPLFRETEG